MNNLKIMYALTKMKSSSKIISEVTRFQLCMYKVNSHIKKKPAVPQKSKSKAVHCNAILFLFLFSSSHL